MHGVPSMHEDVNQAQHRISSTNQHAANMGTGGSASHDVCGAARSRETSAKWSGGNVEVAVQERSSRAWYDIRAAKSWTPEDVNRV